MRSGEVWVSDDGITFDLAGFAGNYWTSLANGSSWGSHLLTFGSDVDPSYGDYDDAYRYNAFSLRCLSTVLDRYE